MRIDESRKADKSAGVYSSGRAFDADCGFKVFFLPDENDLSSVRRNPGLFRQSDILEGLFPFRKRTTAD
jgi:hypothetical protein